MGGPKCVWCQKELADWEGNVMVPYDEWRSDEVKRIIVACKKCTREVRSVDDYHHMWELRWVKNEPIWCLSYVLLNFADEAFRTRSFSKEAVETVIGLAHLAHPDLGKSPILNPE